MPKVIVEDQAADQIRVQNTPPAPAPVNPPPRPATPAAKLQLKRLLNPHRKSRAIPLADTGEPVKLQTAEDTASELVGLITSKARSVESLTTIELALMQRREQVRAVGAATERAASPTQLQDAFYARAHNAARLHFGVMCAALETTRDLEVESWQVVSFFAEACIPAANAELRGTIDLLVSNVDTMSSLPQFGTAALLGPIEANNSPHESTWGLAVVSGYISLNEELVEYGTVATNHTSVMYLSLEDSRLNSLSQVIRNKEGEENVVLSTAKIRVRRASIYETADVVISGAFGSAGMEFRKMLVSQEHGLATPITGCSSTWTPSDKYALYDDKGPFVFDWGQGHMNRIPVGVQVGARGTNLDTEVTNNFNFYGDFTARGTSPSYQIPIRFALNHLRRKLKIHGHSLLVPASERGEAISKLQTRLSTELVGRPPLPFQSLKLVQDTTSVKGLQALARGGVLVKAETRINSRTYFTEIEISAPLLPIVPDDNSTPNGG